MARKRATTIESSDAGFRFRTAAQEQAWQTITDNHITFLLGAAGTGKTQVATAWANRFASPDTFANIVHTRPVVEACESLGWLPGGIEEKVGVYMTPLRKCAAKTRAPAVETLTIPIAYMRGLTLENCITILDEAQNCTFAQLKLYLTRFGHGAKMIICGDTDQADVHNSGLAEMARRLDGLPGVGIFEFSPADTVRHPLVVDIIARCP